MRPCRAASGRRAADPPGALFSSGALCPRGRWNSFIIAIARECLAIRAGRSIRSSEAIETLAELMLTRGVPAHIRSDNGSEFTARVVREWLGGVGAKTLYIEPGSPWENGYVENFNRKLRDELLDREVFYTVLEVQGLTEQYRQTYNRVSPHSSLG